MRWDSVRFAGLSIAAAGLLLAGTTVVRAEEPRQGGTFVWGMSSEMNILDPHATCSWYTTNAIHNMFEGLVMLDLADPEAKRATLRPAIAKSWERSEDGTTYVFQIRENVAFHDGTMVDAEVVKWNYDRFMNADAPQYYDNGCGLHGLLHALDRVGGRDRRDGGHHYPHPAQL